MNEKFEVVDPLSERGKDILSLVKEYKEAEKDIVKNAIKRAIEADYGKKFDVSMLDSLSFEDIEKAVNENKYFLKNNKDIANEAVLFAEKYFKGDRILIEPADGMQIRICRKYGIKRSQIPEVFGVKNEREISKLWASDFVKMFVDKYVRTNITRILESERNNNKYSFEISNTYFNERFYNVDVFILVPVEGLNSDVLYWFKDLLKKLKNVY